MSGEEHAGTAGANSSGRSSPNIVGRMPVVMPPMFQPTSSQSLPSLPPLPPAAQQPHRKKKTADMRFTEEEHKIFLDLMEHHLPLGHEQWMDVTNGFNRQVDEDRRREKAALQDKFNRLVKNKKPTGDPTCPWYVKKAKTIEYQRKNKSNFSALGTEEEEEESGSEAAAGEADDTAMSDVVDDTAMSEVTTATPSVNSRKSRTPKPGKPVKRGKPKNDDGDEKNLIEVWMEQSREDRKEARRRERRRLKAESRRERKHQMFILSAMQSMTACVVAAITKQAPTINTAQDYVAQDEEDESSESSSSSSNNSEKNARKRKSKKGKH